MPSDATCTGRPLRIMGGVFSQHNYYYFIRYIYVYVYVCKFFIRSIGLHRAVYMYIYASLTTRRHLRWNYTRNSRAGSVRIWHSAVSACNINPCSILEPRGGPLIIEPLGPISPKVFAHCAKHTARTFLKTNINFCYFFLFYFLLLLFYERFFFFFFGTYKF